MPDYLIVVVSVVATLVVLLVILVLAQRPILDALQSRAEAAALRSFRLHREMLEAKFFDLASRSGKPRGLRWRDCEWKDTVTFAYENQSQLLTAFAAVEISFEAIEGGDMEDVQAVGRIRDAAAVFHFQNGQWGTGGRALFNMNPHDALERLSGQFTPLRTTSTATR